MRFLPIEKTPRKNGRVYRRIFNWSNLYEQKLPDREIVSSKLRIPQKKSFANRFFSFKFMKFNYRLRIYVDKYDLIPAVLNRIECIWGNYERKA